MSFAEMPLKQVVDVSTAPSTAKGPPAFNVKQLDYTYVKGKKEASMELSPKVGTSSEEASVVPASWEERCEETQESSTADTEGATGEMSADEPMDTDTSTSSRHSVPITPRKDKKKKKSKRGGHS